MKAEIKLYTFRASKKGYPLVAYFRGSGVRKRVVISKFLKNDLYYFQKNEWDAVNNLPVAAAENFELVYPKIVNFKKAFENLMLQNETDINAFLRVLNESDKDLQISLLEKQLNNLKKNTSVGVLAFFDTIIQEKEKTGATTLVYKGTKAQIEKYIVNDCSLNDINYEWLHKFILFKKQQGANESGIMVYLRTLRALYKEAQRRESLNVKPGNPFLGMIKNVSAPVEVDFKPAYFEKILNYVPKKSTKKSAAFNMKRAVNVWLFQFLIGGHDFVDVALLTWSQLKNNRVKFRRYKNRSKPQGGPQIDNLLCSRAIEIFKKYGTKKGKRVFDFIPHPIEKPSTYVNYRSNYNRTLRTISNDLELPSTLKSKSTRYVFRSLAGELLMSDLVIMQLQGHKAAGVTFGYQKRLPNSVVDEHLLKIVDQL